MTELGLDEYLSAHDEVKALQKENEQLKQRLLREIKSKSQWRRKYEKLRPSRYLEVEKRSRAIDMIVAFDAGDKSKTLAEIAVMLDINYRTLTSMARVLRQAML